MKAQNCNPGKGVPKKTSKRWVATVSWLCVGVITCAVLFCIYQEATQYNESFHKIKISDRGSIFIDLRLKNIEQLGGKTFAVTEMLVSAKRIKDPEQLTVTVGSKAFKRGNRYSLIGNYDFSKKHFKGENKEIRIRPILGSFSWFPFDDLSFNMSITIAGKTKIPIPNPPFSKIHLYQEQEGVGYVFKNIQFGPISNSTNKGATIYIKFLLARTYFAKIAFVVYASLIILYIFIALWSIKKFDSTLLMSVIGFITSLWAIWDGLNSFRKGHFTVVDYFFLIVPLVVLLIILAKIIIHHYTTEEAAPEESPELSEDNIL